MPIAATNPADARTMIAATGLWRIEDGAVVAVDRAWTGPLTVMAPSEKILIAVIDLPFASRRKRVEAAPYAIEGLIADALAQVHVALGAEVAPRRHLCAVVRHEVMRDWLAILDSAGLDQCILLPDALSVPEAPPGAWRVAIQRGRALVRADDGSGFALDAALLPTAWEAGGRPRLIAEGDPLPEVMREGVEEDVLQLVGSTRPEVVAPPVDLRQGIYAARPLRQSPWRLVGAVAVLGLVAHLALMAIDTVVLDSMADRREAETRRLVRERQPGLETTPDLVAAVDQLAPTPAIGDGPAFRLLSRSAGALTGQPLTYRAISYGAARPMTVFVSATDASAIDGAVAALNRSTLPARAAADAAGGPGVNAVITLQPAGTSE